MSATVVNAKVPKAGGVEVSYTFDFGDDLAHATELFGAQVVFDSFVDTQVIRLQSSMRSCIEKGKSEKEMQELLADWKPGVSRARIMDPLAAFVKMDATEQEKYIEKLMEIARKK